MNYPKMLYKGKSGYTDTAAIGDDLARGNLKTHIVADEDQELICREEGWHDLAELMHKPESKRHTITVKDKGVGTHAA